MTFPDQHMFWIDPTGRRSAQFVGHGSVVAEHESTLYLKVFSEDERSASLVRMVVDADAFTLETVLPDLSISGANADGVAPPGTALVVTLAEQLVRQDLHPLFDAALGLREGLPAEPIELGRCVASGVFLNLIQAIDRQKQLIAARILDDDQVDRHARHLFVFEAAIAPDPVIGVDDQIARRERAQIFEEGAGLRRAALGGSVRALPEDFLFGEQHEAVQRRHGTARQWRDGDVPVCPRSAESRVRDLQ